jgi:UDP-N-acetylmuramoyl-tripeptide--D-alanyl-D-alanine ligase
LEGFGGVAGVIEGEMYRHLSLNDKFVFVNLDAIQIEKRRIKSCSFGVNRMMQMYLLHQLKANPFVEVHYSNITISSFNWAL